MPTHSYGYFDAAKAKNRQDWYNYYLSLGCGTGKAYDVSKRKENKLFVPQQKDKP